MTKRGSSDDLNLKLRARRLLWSMGYYCPLEVDLTHYDYPDTKLKRWSLTDIDVLGIKFENDLSFKTIIVDCKGGDESSPNRIFWLRGVMDFFGADEGYFIKKQIHEHGRSIAPRLRIRTIDSRGLEKLEQQLSLDKIKLDLMDEKKFLENRSLWGIVVPKNGKPTPDQLKVKKVYQYLQYLYWFIEEYRNIQNIIDRFQLVANILTPLEKRDKYLVYVGFIRFSLSLLKTANVVVSKNILEVPEQVKQYVFGGPFFLREREHFIEMLNKISEKKIGLEPAYFNDLLEIINRLVKYSQFAKHVPRYLEAVMLEHFLGSKTSLQEIFGNDYSVDSIVLSKQIGELFLKATGLNNTFLSELMSL